MASINWPSALSDVLVSNATVSEPGLTGWWSMNTVSEYPTGSSPTYFQDAWATVDGWTAIGGGAVSSIAGRLRHTSASTGNEYLQRFFSPSYAPAGKSIKARIRLVSGTVTDILMIGEGYISLGVTIVPTTEWQTFDINPVSNWSANQSVLVFDFQGQSANCVIEFDWIYIGDGSYAANSLLDNSGNGNHAQIFGATPTDGVSGKALSFDGVNDYARKATISMAGSSFSFSVRYYNRDTTFGIFACPGLFNVSGIRMFSNGGTQTATVRIAAPSVDESLVTNLPAPLNTWSHYVVVVDCITRGWSVFYNGVLFASGTSTGTPVMPDTFSLGAEGAGSSPDSCIIDEPRIYNRALSAAEVLYLYQNPSPYVALPSAPLQDGYSETKQNGVIRSSVDAGAPKMRQRFTAVTRQYNVSFALTNVQSQILDYFYYTTTSQGVALFNWTDPRTGASVEARFIEPPVHRPNGPEYVTSCTLEVLP